MGRDSPLVEALSTQVLSPRPGEQDGLQASGARRLRRSFSGQHRPGFSGNRVFMSVRSMIIISDQ